MSSLLVEFHERYIVPPGIARAVDETEYKPSLRTARRHVMNEGARLTVGPLAGIAICRKLQFDHDPTRWCRPVLHHVMQGDYRAYGICRVTPDPT